MRYKEVLEAASIVRQSAAATEKRRRAREQLAASDKKRREAVRKYHDDVARAREAGEKAKAELRKTAVPETEGATRSSLRRLRDRHGALLGWIEATGRLLQAKDRHGSVLGWYDPRCDITRDKRGNIVGTGDFLCALIFAVGTR